MYRNDEIKKGFITDSISRISIDALLTVIAIPTILWIGRMIINKGFSYKTNILFFLWLLAFLGWTISLNIFLLIRKERVKSIRFLLWPALILTIILSVWLLISCLNEPQEGIFSIYVHEDSTTIPNKLIMKRGFPEWASFLDTIHELQYDPVNKKFTTTKKVRCGRWYVVPSPSYEYDPIEKVYKIPYECPYKKIDHLRFHKRMGQVYFQTFTKDKDGKIKPLEGASISINPCVPFGFDSQERTPCSMRVEMGSYKIVFKLSGFQDSDMIEKIFLPNERVTVDCVLEELPDGDYDSGDTGKDSDMGNGDEMLGEETLIPEVEIDNIIIQVKCFFENGKYFDAILLLSIIASNFPDTLVGSEARQVLEEIKNKLEEK
ncbi:MAG: hypothetical protein KAT34_13365 [Candidatus Aminicenantes bacterium]|nr:hypothetical protein [Candidatus Aminicenantes bacterium]